jgi:hypothetical protein
MNNETKLRCVGALPSQPKVNGPLSSEEATEDFARFARDGGYHASISVDIGDFGWVGNGLLRHCYWRSTFYDTVGRIG